MWVWSLMLGRSPGEGNGNPLQYSCLGNPMNRGPWWATVHGITESNTTLWLRNLSLWRRWNAGNTSKTLHKKLQNKAKYTTIHSGTVATTPRFASVPYLFTGNKHFYYISHHESALFIEKCLNSRKMRRLIILCLAIGWTIRVICSVEKKHRL